MSSLLRRIQRQLSPSQKVHRDDKGAFFSNPPRKVFFGRSLVSTGRGSKLGVSNPQDKALLARKRREQKHAALAAE